MNMNSQVEKVVELFRAVARHPNPTGVTVLKGSLGGFAIVSNWSQRSLEHGRRVKFQLTHLVDSSLNKPNSTLPIDISSIALSGISKSEKLRAVVQEISSENSSKKYVLEIWRTHQLWHTFDLSALDLHGDVYNDCQFGCLEWSPCEKKVLYVAEVKKPKVEPFYKPKSSSKDTSVGDPKPLKGEEYVYREEWGEQLVGKHQSCLVICQVETETIKVCSGIPAEYCPGPVFWTPEGEIVGVCVQSTPRRLGLIYCTNRPSFIFHLASDGSFKIISSKDMSARSPRFSPDGKVLVWLERPVGGPHHACHRVVKYKWPSGQPETVLDFVSHQKTLENKDIFYGAFCDSLPRRCFSKDSNHIVFSSMQKFKTVSYVLSLESGSIFELKVNEAGSINVLDVYEDLVVCSKSSFQTPASLIVSRLALSSAPSWTPLTDWQIDASPENLVVHYLPFSSPGEGEVRSFSAIYFGPAKGAENSIPLIVFLHGGPHSAYQDSFSIVADFFTRLGFGTLFVNYRGSVGQGQACVEFLLGRGGDSDVQDIRQATAEVLKVFPCLNPDAIVLFGGSYGGFLIAHLTAQYPLFYKAVASVNPVIDVATMFPATDIPDWAAVESGSDYKGWVEDSVLWEKMRAVSPMRLLDKIRTPTLFLIGKNDLRVPPSQGISLYHALKERNIKTKMYVYADNHALGTVPVELDSLINAALWFLEHLGINKI